MSKYKQMKMKGIERVAKTNPWFASELANMVNKTSEEIYSTTCIWAMIFRWKKWNIRVANKKILTEAINKILGSNYTIEELDTIS